MYQCPICNRWTVPCKISGVRGCQECYDKRKKPMNSTDEEKRAIRKMFAEPIDKVQVAMNELVMEESGLSISTDYHLRLNHYMGTLQVKIDNLKAMLPVIQDEP